MRYHLVSLIDFTTCITQPKTMRFSKDRKQENIKLFFFNLNKRPFILQLLQRNLLVGQDSNEGSPLTLFYWSNAYKYVTKKCFWISLFSATKFQWVNCICLRGKQLMPRICNSFLQRGKKKIQKVQFCGKLSLKFESHSFDSNILT